MGLAERRAVKAFQDNHYPTLKLEVNAAVGFDLLLDIDWPALGDEGYAHMYDEAFKKVYFTPLIDALREIAFDDLGREALQAGLKRVEIRNTGLQDISFSGGVLRFDHHPISNLDYGQERQQQIRQALEEEL